MLFLWEVLKLKMKIKFDLRNVWLILVLFMLTFVPLKICSDAFGWGFAYSSIFLGIFGVALVGFMVLMSMIDIRMKNMSIRKNYGLGIVSLLASVSFFMCISAYFNDTVNKYDFEWEPLFMSIFSILCCISFIIIAVTFFTGKNIVSKVVFFNYCPVLWFGLAMILFLSIYNNNADPYEVSLVAALALFLVYNTQVFSTSSKSNISRLLFVFGIPCIILSFIHCVPIILNYVGGKDVTDVAIASGMVEFSLGLYAFLTLLDVYSQIGKSEEPEVRSVTID